MLKILRLQSAQIKKLQAILVVLLISFILSSCKNTNKASVQIAFIADAHFQDIYAHFGDANYKGILNSETGSYVNIRTMEAQLHSTRLFNENYFAFIEALDDIVDRGIKYVALPGDFSDDGQPIHAKGLRKVLEKYATKHGILFFATTGNHDPVKPYTQNSGKTDFLGEGGRAQAIMSFNKKLKPLKEGDLKPIITDEIKKWGYKDILNEMSAFGFYPQKEYLYWETPFSKYSYSNYSYTKAQEAAVLNNRTYSIDAFNKHPDASYLVEPTEGVWLLAIDANVYMPTQELSEVSMEPSDFEGASIGYNNVLLQKRHLIDWVNKVSKEAAERGKVLIAFSHYPMVDFNDNASEEMKAVFGGDNLQLHRVPQNEVAETFANAGIQIHFGGHMHINDTGVFKSKEGNTLFNIQTPSLAAYAPGYKVLSIKNSTAFEVETIVINKAKDFNSLFSLYKKEHRFLQSTEPNKIWDIDILKTEDYRAFTKFHLKELVRLRFIPNDWPQTFTDSLLSLSGKDLLMKGVLKQSELETILVENKTTLADFETWNGFDMVNDFYKLRSADELAFQDIGERRLKQYSVVCNQLQKSTNKTFQLWGSIFEKSKNGMPSNHFEIDLKSSSIKRLPN